MNPTSFRQIAETLGLSASTVSRAFHGDPRIREETARRVMAALKAADYQLDPIVSTGMSKIRQRVFFRETLAWCRDASRESSPSYSALFQSAEVFGARLGYKIEHFHFENTQPRELKRLASVWKARGIRGVILGPFRTAFDKLAFPWNDFAWVVIGRPFEQPHLHSVGRDYQLDLRDALRWLGDQGCRRICFLQNPEMGYAFHQPMLLASLAYYHSIHSGPPTPCFEPDSRHPQKFKVWLKEIHPDGLILPAYPNSDLRRMLGQKYRSLPMVFLTSHNGELKPNQACFETRFNVMGQASVNFLHRLLSNREIGIPEYKQSVLINSGPLIGSTGPEGSTF